MFSEQIHTLQITLQKFDKKEWKLKKIVQNKHQSQI